MGKMRLKAQTAGAIRLTPTETRLPRNRFPLIIERCGKQAGLKPCFVVTVMHAKVIGMHVRQLLPRWIGTVLLGCCSSLVGMTLLVTSLLVVPVCLAQEPAAPETTEPLAGETPERNIELGPK
jgi:hypothetical protein